MRSRQTGYSSTLDFWKYSVYFTYTLSSSAINFSRCHLIQRLVITLMVVVLHPLSNGLFQFPDGRLNQLNNWTNQCGQVTPIMLSWGDSSSCSQCPNRYQISMQRLGARRLCMHLRGSNCRPDLREKRRGLARKTLDALCW